MVVDICIRDSTNSRLLIHFAVDYGNPLRVYNVGVLMASHLDSPFDLERCGPAVDLALEEVNEFLKVHNVQLRKVQGRYTITLCSILITRLLGSIYAEVITSML